MSLIFDALQRSETERSGTKLPALSAATEVLRLAELHVAAERQSVAESVSESTAQSVEHDTSSCGRRTTCPRCYRSGRLNRCIRSVARESNRLPSPISNP